MEGGFTVWFLIVNVFQNIYVQILKTCKTTKSDKHFTDFISSLSFPLRSCLMIYLFF